MRARATRLLDPANWAMLANAFAARGVRVPPAVAAELARKVTADPAALELLPPHYLAAFAWGLGRTFAPPVPESAAAAAVPHIADVRAALAAIAARAVALGALRAPDHANLSVGCELAGVPLPQGIAVLPDVDVPPSAAPGTEATPPPAA